MLLSLLSKRSLEVDSRDAYGFALRPQHIQAYKEYAYIYQEEEDERLDKWLNFIDLQIKFAQPPVPEEIYDETPHTEPTTLEEEAVSESGGGNDSSGTDSAFNGSTEKEAQRKKICDIGVWIQIRPSLSSIDNLMSTRVKNRKKMAERKKTVEPKPNVGDFADEALDDADKVSDPESDEINGLSSEPFFPWKQELECLVHGGVPKELRGEVWQAFLGVRTRRVEKYYQGLLADTDAGDSKETDNSSGVPPKWRKQIEKDIPRTFPGHPALDDSGRSSLRRLLLAYARHNPSVGYCQAMNFFAGLLLLLMPEENAFWALVGIIDDYFEGYYTEQMIESQVDQLVFEELVRERFPKLVNHLDYLGVQVTWVSASWFLSIFVNMLPWESVLRVWDVLLFEGNRVMLFRTALALMELYGPLLLTTKDAGDAVSVLQSLAGSTFDSSQLVITACMGFLAVTEGRLQELRQKHRPSVLQVIEERSKGVKVWKDSKGVGSKLYSFKHDSMKKEKKASKERSAEKDTSQSDSPSDFDEFIKGLTVDSEADSVPDLQEQVNWLKIEMCRLLEEKRSAVLRAEELETALMDMVKEDNRLQLSARMEELEQEVAELRQNLLDKKQQEAAMIQVLKRVEQDQKMSVDACKLAEQEAAAQKSALEVLEEKYDKAMSSVTKMEKRVIMAESMLEATLQYETSQIKAQTSGQ